MISWLASECGWEGRFAEELLVSEGWRVSRHGKLAGSNWGWVSGGSSSSGCHIGLPGMLGWVGVGR